MLAYYISQSNQFTVRTAPTASITSPEYPIVINPLFRLDLQNMYTNVNYTASLSGSTYNPYESLLYFTASIASASIGDEYRARLSEGTSSIWNGSIQVYSSQSLDSAQYVNQIPNEERFISNVTDNKYIILD
jgi:hypothetical protein